MLQPSTSRRHLTVASLALSALLLGACGSSGTGGAQVASLGTLADDPAAETATTVSPQDTQEAMLAYAACMRDQGIDMDDPTFDANGNPTGPLMFNRDSGIDPRSEEFQTAQTECGHFMEGVTFGGPRGALDRDEIQQAMNSFTECLRDEGLDVDDIDFGDGQGRVDGGPGFGPPGGTVVETNTDDGGQATPGTVVNGGFGGPPPDGGGRGGFDPTTRTIEQLGLDADDPDVAAAVEACKSLLESAFQPQTSSASGAPTAGN
jgi:hypothetical protein